MAGMYIGMLLVDALDLADRLGVFDAAKYAAVRTARRIDDYFYTLTKDTEERLRDVRLKHESDIAARMAGDEHGGDTDTGTESGSEHNHASASDTDNDVR